MSIGNACAAIGLANTNKIPAIGAYVQDAPDPVDAGPGADGPYVGVNGSTYWASNVIGEDYTEAGGYLVPANSGAATGKTARWVSNTASLTVAADRKCSVSAGGVITATATTGLYIIDCAAAGAVIPANSFMWAFLL